ncbi:MAG: ABC transporter substrate-binding protein [Tissierellia bacterium]|nr:ABC transporter substrate-binding protein [Tissierellia bacterium]
MKKVFLFFILILLTSCNNYKQDQINICILNPLTESESKYGISSYNAQKLAIKRINNQGGINGKIINAKFKDDKSDPNLAKKIFKDNYKNTDFFIGGTTTNVAEVISHLSEKEKILFITPSATGKEITKNKKYTLRLCYTNDYQGRILANYIDDNYKNKKILALVNKSLNYSNEIVDSFNLNLKNNNSLETIYYEDTKDDFKILAIKIKKQKPDFILIADYYQKLNLIIPKIREENVNSIFIGPDSWDGMISKYQNELSDLDESIFSSHFSYFNSNKNVVDFTEEYEKEYGEKPDSFAALGYDSIYCIKEILENDHKEVEFEGVSGYIKTNGYGDAKKSANIIKIKNSNYYLLKDKKAAW